MHTIFVLVCLIFLAFVFFVMAALAISPIYPTCLMVFAAAGKYLFTSNENSK